MNDRLRSELKTSHPLAIAPVIQTEGFALHASKSRGVLVRGIDSDNFSAATGLDVKIPAASIAIGSELAKDLNLKAGDDLAITLGKGHESSGALPSIRVFKVSQIIKHGIYQKDLRFVYLDRHELAGILNVDDKVNLVILSLFNPKAPLKELAPVEDARQKLRYALSSEFYVRPFWSEYAFLIEAVKVEKFSISLILQLIVVVAVFNIMAFVIYIMEKKAQDFFFLRAVGMSLGTLMRFWLTSVIIIWAVSCVIAQILSLVFDWGLHHLPFLQIPGEIYVLSSLSIRLDFQAYATVYIASLLWVILATGFGYLRMRNRPIIQGLRQEFN